MLSSSMTMHPRCPGGVPCSPLRIWLRHSNRPRGWSDSSSGLSSGDDNAQVAVMGLWEELE